MKSCELRRAAEDWIVAYLKKTKNVDLIKRQKGETGFDFKYNENGRTIKIEVKGTEKDYNIPNCYTTEFKEKVLTADLLYVVYYENDTPKRLFAMPREVINPKYITSREIWHIKKTKEFRETVMANYKTDL